MAKTREIKGRMKAVSNIQRITKTMQMIATARFQASQRRATQAKPYTEKIAELVRDLANTAGSGSDGGGGGTIDHPLLRQAPVDQGDARELLLVISSNRGLCGGYNANILRTATGYLKERGQDRTILEAVGKKGVAFFKFAGISVSTVHEELTDGPEFEKVQQLAEQYIRAYSEGEVTGVKVAYMAFHSMSRQQPAIVQLLPLQSPTGSESDGAQGNNPPHRSNMSFPPARKSCSPSFSR